MYEHAAVTNFIAIAQNYCYLIEGASTGRDSWLAKVQHELVQLYAAGFELPEIEAQEIDEGGVIPDLSHEQWATVYRRISTRLKSNALYWHYPNPTKPPDSESLFGYGDVADDLTDIYRDIKNGLLRWEQNVESLQRDAVWEWKFLHSNHWGVHASWVIPVLHQLVYVRGLRSELNTTVDGQKVSTSEDESG